MIYLVTANQQLFESDIYKVISVGESLQIMKNWKMIQFDTETTGLDAHIDTSLMWQFGNIEETIQIVVDGTTVDLKNYKEILEEHFIIGANLAFDCKFAFKEDIIPRKVYDCMVVEQLLYLGFPNFMIGANEDIINEYCEAVDDNPDWSSLKSAQKNAYITQVAPDVAGFISYHSGVSLKAMCHRYLDEEMDKSVRGEIIWRGLDDTTILYGAGDVKPLYRIMRKQMEIIKQRNMVKAAQVECNFVPVKAYFEWCGVHMNEALWKQKMSQDEQKRDTALNKLNEFVVNFGDKRFYQVNLQGDLWSGFDTTPKCTINWNSTPQIIPFLTALGFNCKGINKKTKEEKDSIEASVLKPQRDVNPEFYDTYLAYSEANKVCTTYGQNYLNAINPKTNRVHTTFRALGTDTGRLACGSQQQNVSLAKLKGLPCSSKTAPKDTKLKCAYPQLQNLPADELTRACFCAEKGNVWISRDYKGEESVLMADFSQDKAMMDVFLKGEDMHSTVAYMLYVDDIPRDTSIKDIKKLYKHLRQEAKGPEFCFAYAGNDSTLVQQYGMTPEKTKSIYDNYMKGFPGIAKFQATQKKFVVDHGYILISPVTGHKSYWWDWKYWKKVQSTFDSQFWEEYRTYHKGTGDYIAKKVSTHFKAKTKYEKNACNSPLQGSGAIIFKIFCKMLFDWVVDKGYFNVVKFCIPVHDELNIECPEALRDIADAKLGEVMKEAAKPFLKTLELDSDSEISDHWIH